MNSKKHSLPDSRNYGIDILRLYSMLLVITLHIFCHGGVLDNATGLSNNIVWVFEIIAYCAVNCYAMISGFVQYSEKEKPYQYSKYATLWLQVVFYSFGITLLTYFIDNSSISIKFLVKSLLPVTTKQYWYFSAYTGLFFIVPWLNRFIRNLSEAQMTRFILIVFLVFSCYGNLIDPFSMNYGYSFVWLVIMYLFGAWLKKCQIPQKVRSRYAALTLVLCLILTWVVKMFSPLLNSLFVSYISPTIVLVSLCYIILFSKLNINNTIKRVTKFLSPAAFGVYLIHEQNIMREKFVLNKFVWICELKNWLIPLAVIVSSLSIFVVCITIERIRLSIFKLLRINKSIENLGLKLEKYLKEKWNKFMSVH